MQVQDGRLQKAFAEQRVRAARPAQARSQPLTRTRATQTHPTRALGQGDVLLRAKEAGRPLCSLLPQQLTAVQF